MCEDDFLGVSFHRSDINLYFSSVVPMSVTGRTGIGIPTILLHECESLVATVEMKDGTLYRGKLVK